MVGGIYLDVNNRYIGWTKYVDLFVFYACLLVCLFVFCTCLLNLFVCLLDLHSILVLIIPMSLRFRFAGRLIGYAIIQGHLLDVFFARHIYKSLLGR